VPVAFDITVSDDAALSFTNCPIANIMKPNDTGECEADVTWEDPELINLGDCSGAGTVPVIITVTGIRLRCWNCTYGNFPRRWSLHRNLFYGYRRRRYGGQY
jgi:hypothetical protein